MRVRSTIIGNFPKIPAGPGPSMRTALNRFDQGTISPREVEHTIRQVTGRVLGLFADAGVDLATDGLIRWNDLMDPICRDIENCQVGGLERLYDNNFYYRQPVIVGRLRWAGSTLQSWLRVSQSLTALPLKAVCPGPFTIVDLALNRSYDDEARLLADLVEVLRLEAEALAAAGVAEVQWDEPALVAGRPRDSRLVAAVLGDLLRDAPYPQGLALYWGDAAGWLDSLVELGADRLYLDLTASPLLWTRLARERLPLEVGLGVIDGRRAVLEGVEDTAAKLAPLIATQGADRVWVHPNGGLELLPPDIAEAKVRRLGELAARLQHS